ncbi:hypothetical protein RHSIM_Rhsim12G0162800 [Rhododendron simsii]|uniref:F-box associated beta-propeller type 3 domain-containing protein n=1 Tax=Rhododendron simsii TaxID=118357 RepID=A0A834G4F5_RHOSS|nr:hypothetical protein RHSIM_Rhsim12G0162800 [Rhododendron simsii]
MISIGLVDIGLGWVDIGLWYFDSKRSARLSILTSKDLAYHIGSWFADVGWKVVGRGKYMKRDINRGPRQYDSTTDIASMLDEVIEYLKQLQAQVHLMSSATRNNLPQMMMLAALGLHHQQQIQMSLLARMGMGMGVGLGMGMGMGPTFLPPPHPFVVPPMIPTHNQAQATTDAAAVTSQAYPNFSGPANHGPYRFGFSHPGPQAHFVNSGYPPYVGQPSGFGGHGYTPNVGQSSGFGGQSNGFGGNSTGFETSSDMYPSGFPATSAFAATYSPQTGHTCPGFPSQNCPISANKIGGMFPQTGNKPNSKGGNLAYGPGLHVSRITRKPPNLRAKTMAKKDEKKEWRERGAAEAKFEDCNCATLLVDSNSPRQHLKTLPRSSGSEVLRSSNGLMLCTIELNNYVVCNLTTQRFVVLPKLGVVSKSYFWLDDYLIYDPKKSPYYKVVVVSLSLKLGTSQIDVYSSESGSWKSTIATPMIPMFGQRAVWNGAIFLMGCGPGTQSCLKHDHFYFQFDVDAERISTTGVPCPPYHSKGILYLGECGGHLLAIQIPDGGNATEFKVLEMKDGEDKFRNVGANENDLAVVLCVGGLVVQYNIKCKTTLKVLCDLAGEYCEQAAKNNIVAAPVENERTIPMHIKR